MVSIKYFSISIKVQGNGYCFIFLSLEKTTCVMLFDSNSLLRKFVEVLAWLVKLVMCIAPNLKFVLHAFYVHLLHVYS